MTHSICITYTHLYTQKLIYILHIYTHTKYKRTYICLYIYVYVFSFEINFQYSGFVQVCAMRK